MCTQRIHWNFGRKVAYYWMPVMSVLKYLYWSQDLRFQLNGKCPCGFIQQNALNFNLSYERLSWNPIFLYEFCVCAHQNETENEMVFTVRSTMPWECDASLLVEDNIKHFEPFVEHCIHRFNQAMIAIELCHCGQIHNDHRIKFKWCLNFYNWTE